MWWIIYIDSPYWIKNKNATISSINKKDNKSKFFQYALTFALNREEIREDHQRIAKIKPLTNKYKSKKKKVPIRIR